MERAIESSKQEFEGKDNSLFEGTQLTYKLLEQTLARNGVIKDFPIDKKYDAIKHEAM